MSVRRRLVQWSVPFALAGSLAVLISSAPTAAAHVRGPRHKAGRGTSTNWSGYAVDGTNATQVTGSWTQPAVSCAPGENSWSSPWVGIDGDVSNTVEQIGTDSDCQSGKAVYYAWYEMYPKSLVKIAITVGKGDSFTGSVSYSSSGFTLKLTDNTTGARFATVQAAKKVQRSSVEWIMEGPSNGTLSDFGSVQFSAASATINNQSAGLSSLTGAQSITMVDSAGTTRAQPSGLSGDAFSVAWKHP